ncbi:hypothetical protein BANRA_00612 [Acinetobacter baumannii]|nr:hypothetical protein BANRA_00612 [Acinetobacter baumannii]
MIKDLTIHGHFNKDIWLITQDPARIEKGIHKLIDKMYFIKRPSSKPPYTNVLYLISGYLALNLLQIVMLNIRSISTIIAFILKTNIKSFIILRLTIPVSNLSYQNSYLSMYQLF